MSFFHYKLLDGKLIGSEHPLTQPRRLIESFIQDNQIAAGITLTTRPWRPPTALAEHFHLPCENVPPREVIERAMAIIGERVARGEAVWVHCQQGIDRTGCVIGCYLASGGMPVDEVIDELLARFPSRRRERRILELWKPYGEMIEQFGISRSGSGRF